MIQAHPGLSKFLGRDVKVSDGKNGPAPMAAYFGLVAAGIYETTDTAARVLGRRPRAYVDWLERHPPVADRADVVAMRASVRFREWWVASMRVWNPTMTAPSRMTAPWSPHFAET